MLLSYIEMKFHILIPKSQGSNDPKMFVFELMTKVQFKLKLQFMLIQNKWEDCREWVYLYWAKLYESVFFYSKQSHENTFPFEFALGLQKFCFQGIKMGLGLLSLHALHQFQYDNVEEE